MSLGLLILVPSCSCPSAASAAARSRTRSGATWTATSPGVCTPALERDLTGRPRREPDPGVSAFMKMHYPLDRPR